MHPMKSILRLALICLLASTPLAHAQDWAKAMLEKSPRHREYVAIKQGSHTLTTFVVYPEVSTKAPVVILIHEIFGLSDWMKSMADDLAAQGFIVVAPDLLSGYGANGGGTSEMANMDATTKAVTSLNADEVTADLDAVAEYTKTIPSANGKLAVAGFCWGGGKTFAFATHRHDLSAALVFYGPGPADVTTITAPVYGFYAGNDARIGATLPATTDAMKAAKKFFEPITYDGAGHGFMRAGVDPANTNAANVAARKEGFARLVKVLKEKTSAKAATTHPSKVSAKKKKTTAAEVICHDPTMTMQGTMQGTTQGTMKGSMKGSM